MADVFDVIVAALSGAKVNLSDRDKDRFDGRACNSEGVSETWTDPDVRASRSRRDGVRVTLSSGEVRTYTSTRAAFRDLRLPDNKHIRFRGELKAARVHTFELCDGREYRFEIVQRDANVTVTPRVPSPAKVSKKAILAMTPEEFEQYRLGKRGGYTQTERALLKKFISAFEAVEPEKF